MPDIRDFRINNDRFDEGYKAGYEAGFDKSWPEGYKTGQQDGFIAGHEMALTTATDNEHFAAGYKAGVSDTERLLPTSYDEGYDEGYDAGREQGIAEGYDDKP